MISKKIVKIFALTLGLCLVGTVKTIRAVEVVNYENWVTDKADIYSTEFEQKLNQQIDSFEKESGVEIAVLTINKLDNKTIEEYAVEVFKKWAVGKKDKDNGILLLISKDDRQVKIEVGYGMESKITDGRAGRIIREEILPQFKLENYEQGTFLAIERIIDYIKTNQEDEEIIKKEIDNGGLFDDFKVISLGFLFLIYLASFLGRSSEFVTGGIVGFLIGLVFSGLRVAIVLTVIGLILDLVLSSNFKKLKRNGRAVGFWKSGGGFKSSGSRDGFGGFGGGSSGGGGASGKW